MFYMNINLVDNTGLRRQKSWLRPW